MSKSNKKAKEELIKLYGKECFIDKLHLRTDEFHYKGKGQLKKMERLTYHHILEKSKGGKATVENGALLSQANHEWFNSQPQEIQEKLNKAFQDYKRGFIVNVAEIRDQEIIKYHQITFEEMGIGYETISLEDNTEEDLEFLQLSDEEEVEYKKRKESLRKKAYSRFPKKELGKAHIDPEWQREIMQDVIDELRY